MKQAKRQGEMRRHAVCGSCSRTIKIRGEKDKVACTSSLEIMPVDHESDCEDFLPVVTNDAVVLPEANESLREFHINEDAAMPPAEAP